MFFTVLSTADRLAISRSDRQLASTLLTTVSDSMKGTDHGLLNVLCSVCRSLARIDVDIVQCLFPLRFGHYYVNQNDSACGRLEKTIRQTNNAMNF